MKNILLFVAFAVTVLCAFTGCYKQTVYPNSVVATIDTIAYNASGDDWVIFRVDTAAANQNPQRVTITSKTKIYTPGTTTQPVINLTMPTALGTYYFPGDISATVVTSATGSDGTAAKSGYITVHRTSGGRFEGTFSFTCVDGTTVTNGGFNGVLAYY